MEKTIIHRLIRFTLAFIFAYHGLIPKLIARHQDEQALLRLAGIPEAAIIPTLITFGLAELLLALFLLLYWRQRWPVWLIGIGMAIATVATLLLDIRLAAAAFNPITLNLAVICLAVIDLHLLADQKG